MNMIKHNLILNVTDDVYWGFYQFKVNIKAKTNAEAFARLVELAQSKDSDVDDDINNYLTTTRE